MTRAERASSARSRRPPAAFARERDRAGGRGERPGRPLPAWTSSVASGELGLLAVNVPAAYGGSEARRGRLRARDHGDRRAPTARTAVTMAVTNMVGETIARFGTEEQRRRCLPRLASGEWLAGAFGLSEPQAGSDAGGDAHARGAAAATAGSSTARSSGSRAATSRASSSSGRRPTPGAGARGDHRLPRRGGARPGSPSGGTRRRWASGPSSTVSLAFDGCEVPDAARLGERRGGVPDRARRARRRADRHRRAGDGHDPRRARREPPLREGAPRLRQAHRRAPGDRVHARRHGHRARRGPAPDAPRGRAQGGGARRSRARRRWRSSSRARRPSGRSSRAVQIHGGYGYTDGVPGRAALPRRARADDLRGDERDPAARHRAGAAAGR